MRHILSPSDQLFFIHIPKTAGTSFTAILENHYAADDHCPAHSWKELQNLPQERLKHYHLFTGHINYAFTEMLDRPVVITLLRDPVERVLSHFSQLKRSGKQMLVASTRNGDWGAYKGNPYKDLWHDDITLEDYLKIEPLHRDIDNTQTRYIGTTHSARELLAHGQNAIGEHPPLSEVLPLALERLETCAFAGLTERFNESVDLLTYTLGWKPENSMPTLNTAPQRPTQQSILAQSLAFIRSLNDGDIQLYERARTLMDRHLEDMRRHLLHIEYQHRYEAVKTDRYEWQPLGVLPGAGWSPPDPDNPHIRWMANTESTLELPLTRDKSLLISFRIVNVLAQDILDSFAAYVNQHPLELTSTTLQEGGMLIQAIIKPEMLVTASPFSVISFHVNRTVRPSEVLPDNQDDRLLSVAIADLKITPLDGGQST